MEPRSARMLNETSTATSQSERSKDVRDDLDECGVIRVQQPVEPLTVPLRPAGRVWPKAHE